MIKRDPTGKEDAIGCFTVIVLAVFFAVILEVFKR